MHIDYSPLIIALQRHLPEYTFDEQVFMQSIAVQQLPAGAFFPDTATAGTPFAFILQGTFRMFYVADGKDINMQFLFEHELLVDYNRYINSDKHRFNIQALENAVIVSIDVQQLFARYPQHIIEAAMDRYITQSIVHITTDHVHANMYLNGETRYRRLYENKPAYFNRIPLYHIASYLGMEKESLSRIRRTIIEKQKKHIPLRRAV